MMKLPGNYRVVYPIRVPQMFRYTPNPGHGITLHVSFMFFLTSFLVELWSSSSEEAKKN